MAKKMSQHGFMALDLPTEVQELGGDRIKQTRQRLEALMHEQLGRIEQVRRDDGLNERGRTRAITSIAREALDEAERIVAEQRDYFHKNQAMNPAELQKMLEPENPALSDQAVRAAAMREVRDDLRALAAEAQGSEAEAMTDREGQPLHFSAAERAVIEAARQGDRLVLAAVEKAPLSFHARQIVRDEARNEARGLFLEKVNPGAGARRATVEAAIGALNSDLATVKHALASVANTTPDQLADTRGDVVAQAASGDAEAVEAIAAKG